MVDSQTLVVSVWAFIPFTIRDIFHFVSDSIDTQSLRSKCLSEHYDSSVDLEWFHDEVNLNTCPVCE